MSIQVEAFDELIELHRELLQKVADAEDIMRSEFPEQARYSGPQWLAHIKQALGTGEYPTCGPTMESTLRDIEGEVYEV